MGIYETTIKDIIKELFYFPCIVVAVSSVFLIGHSLRFIRAYRQKKQHFNCSRFLVYTFPIVVLLLLLCIHCSLLQHGVFLPFEKEEDAICITGTVEEAERDILSPRLFLRYMDGRSYSYASKVIIDGEEYYCLTDGDLAAGEIVEFAFLPKSKVILRCSHSIKED